ncbi:hypothetical protein Plhal304r1_c039g0117181 [Plasmopara halstedii]
MGSCKLSRSVGSHYYQLLIAILTVASFYFSQKRIIRLLLQSHQVAIQVIYCLSHCGTAAHIHSYF